MSAVHNSPIFNAPKAVKLIVGATLVAHLVRVYFLTGEKTVAVMVEMAFVPARYSPEFLEAFGMNWSTFVSPLTYMLVHGDFTHLLINVLLILAFGQSSERRARSQVRLAR